MTDNVRRLRYVWLVRTSLGFHYLALEPGDAEAGRYRQVPVGEPGQAHWFTDRDSAQQWADRIHGDVCTFVVTRDGIVSGKEGVR